MPQILRVQNFTFLYPISFRNAFKFLVLCLIGVLGASWFHSDELQDMDGTATVIPKRENLNIVNVTQLDKDSILMCYDNVVKIITPQGMLKVSKKQLSELKFNFNIENISKDLFTFGFFYYLNFL